MRNREWRRKKDFSKAKRKRKIDFYSYYWYYRKNSNNPLDFSTKSGYYNNLHQYSKNKIHCSCPMCSAKTRNKGNRRTLHANYSPSINYKISDKRRIDSMINDVKEYEERINCMEI